MQGITTFEDISLPHDVTIVEVGPRDGLQNEKETVSTQAGSACDIACPTVHIPALPCGPELSSLII